MNDILWNMIQLLFWRSLSLPRVWLSFPEHLCNMVTFLNYIKYFDGCFYNGCLPSRFRCCLVEWMCKQCQISCGFKWKCLGEVPTVLAWAWPCVIPCRLSICLECILCMAMCEGILIAVLTYLNNFFLWFLGTFESKTMALFEESLSHSFLKKNNWSDKHKRTNPVKLKVWVGVSWDQ